ncbi:hypothetical protein C6N75_10620 [Streptomyces solincola]|uniref:Peptidase S1 domain-containing protein n=1 Tax=Streptomyces solincola TaxID=2100817 RepID=A0A2S9PXX6_9ACTN|nr:trypsin-like serine protease [Streptomyces solincola]PRH79255.1 hypothetical protein C6N75_10620 [Streptomyces solincola]
MRKFLMLPTAGIVLSSILLSSPAHAVVGGVELDEDTRAAAFGPLVALEVDKPGTDDDLMEVCGGVKIKEDTVLTAAHCVANETGTFKRISVRGNSLNFLEGGVTADATRMIPHTKFDPASLENDIALLKFSPEALDGIPAAALPSSPADTAQPAILTGWGLTEDGQLPQTGNARAASLRVAGTGGECKTGYDMPPTVFCMNSQDPELAMGSGQGDSGSPVWQERDGKMTVVGVDSWATHGPEGPFVRRGDSTIATQVTDYLNWIATAAN